MKRILRLTAILLFAVMIFSALASCGTETPPETTTTAAPTESDTPAQTTESTTDPSGPAFVMNGKDGVEVEVGEEIIRVSVANETAVFDLNKYVQVRDDVEWQVYMTPEGSNPIITKRLSLSEGSNVFYITVFSNKEEVLAGYTLIITRAGTYTVSFEGLSEKQTVVEGGFAKAPTGIPTREGYNFDSWDYDFTKPVETNITIAAKWIPSNYLITYDPNFGTVAEVTQSVTYGEEAVLQVPTREGYVFAGWYDGDAVVKDGLWTITNDVTLVARWSNRTINVTLDPAGGRINGSEVEVVMRVDYGTNVTFPQPVRDGFSFGGWYNGEALVTDGVFEFAEDLRLSAKWNERASTVIFVENGGDRGSHDEVLKYDEELPIPIRRGYTFGGWFSDIELTQPVYSVPRVDGSTSLYAWWTEEGKPGEFIYTLSGTRYKITDRVDRDSTSTPPAYIGGLPVVDLMERPNPNAGIVLSGAMLTVKVDRTAQINAVFTPKYASDDTTLIYTSLNPEIVAVDQNGVVMGIASGKGTGVIRVSNIDGTYTANCYVAVSAAQKNPDAGITLGMEKIQLLVSEMAGLSVTYTPEYDDDDKTLTFQSSDETIAVVDPRGTVTGVELGTCIVSVSAANGVYTAFCEVQVVTDKTNDNPGMLLSTSSLEINTGWVKTVTATYTPRLIDADRTIYWETSDETVATVEDGVITAVAAGTCVITASDATNEFTASVEVTVNQAGIYVERNDTDLAVGDKGVFIAYVLPGTENGSTAVTYESSDESVAVISDTGEITGVFGGVCTLTATDETGEYSVSVELTVHNIFDIIGGDDVSVERDDYNYNVTLLGSNSFLQLNRLVKIYGNYTWTLSSDPEMRNVIGSKAVSVPATGSVLYFAHLIGSDGSVVETYSLTLMKKQSRYTITLDPDGAVLAETTVTVSYGEAFVLPTPEKDGFEFDGWYYGNTLFTKTVYDIQGNITLKAHFTESSTPTPTTVVPVVHVEEIVFSVDSIGMNVYETAPLTVTVLPEDAADKNYTVSFSTNGIVTYENGVVTALSSAGAVAITVTTDDGGLTATCVVTVDKPVYANPHILHETPDAGMAYQNALTFLGDSTTAHMITYGALADGTATKQVWKGAVQNTISFLYVQDVEIIYPQTGEKMKIVDAAQIAQPQYLVITLGVTGGVSMNLGKDDFLTLYRSLIEDILTVSPDTSIIVQSIFPVGEKRTGDGYDYTKITNEAIIETNGWIVEMVKEYYDNGMDVHYLDTFPLLVGEDGYMKEEYGNGDGLHLGLRGYQVVLENIRKHALTMQ